MPRPSLYTDEILAEIEERLGQGEPLAQICRDESMPAYRTVWDWMQPNNANNVNGKVSKAIARAREEGEEVIASNTRNIARGLDGSTHDVARDKLVIDTDLKLLAKWNPKKYGDKVDVNHGGQNGENPVKSVLTIEVVDATSQKP